ncbi:DUF5719 family protein [Tessaracoccus terricola]
MLRRILETLGYVALLVALVLGITSLSPAALPRVTRVMPPQDNKVVCLPAGGAGVVFAAGVEEIGGLGEPGASAAGFVVLGEQTEPVVLTGTGSLVGGYLNAIGTTKSWTPCGPALAEGMLLVPTAAETELLIVNSDQGEAAVDLTLHGEDGEIRALGARGIAIAPNSSRVIALSVLTEQTGPVAVEFRATRGRATVIARTTTATALDTATAFRAATEHVVAGIPEGAGNATVLLANPTSERVTADISALGATSEYTPLGGSDLSIPAGSTLAVPLGGSLAGEATALRITSDAEIGASVVVGPALLDPAGPVVSEQAFVAPSERGVKLAAAVPAAGVLQLASAGADATVTLRHTVTGGAETETEIAVPAGRTISVPLAVAAPQGQFVEVEADVEVVGAVTFLDGAGMAVVPLQRSGAAAVEPLDAELDPSLQ